VRQYQNKKLYRQWWGYWWKGVLGLAFLAAVMRWGVYPIILKLIAVDESAIAFEKFKQHTIEYGQFLDENERIMAGLKRED
jgi:hypothetical protein